MTLFRRFYFVAANVMLMLATGALLRVAAAAARWRVEVPAAELFRAHGYMAAGPLHAMVHARYGAAIPWEERSG